MPLHISLNTARRLSCGEPRVATHPTAPLPAHNGGCRTRLEHSPPVQRPGSQARRVILLATHRRSEYEGQDGILVPLFSISRFITVQAQPVFGCVDGCHTCLLLSGCPALRMIVKAVFKGRGGHPGKTPRVRCLANSSRQSILFLSMVGSLHRIVGGGSAASTPPFSRLKPRRLTCWSIQARLPVASAWHYYERSAVGPQPSRLSRSVNGQFSWCTGTLQRCLVVVHQRGVALTTDTSCRREKPGNHVENVKCTFPSDNEARPVWVHINSVKLSKVLLISITL